jgi:predicted nucleotidyltransferase
MAETLIPVQVQGECLRFLERLGKHVPISQVVLYGSYAQERAHTWSDVDLAVVSREFRRMPFLKRTILLRRVGLEANTPRIQALGLTPREFESGDRPRIVREVRQGIPMFDA